MVSYRSRTTRRPFGLTGRMPRTSPWQLAAQEPRPFPESAFTRKWLSANHLHHPPKDPLTNRPAPARIVGSFSLSNGRNPSGSVDAAP